MTGMNVGRWRPGRTLAGGYRADATDSVMVGR
jgi:hypothetical protein